MYTYYPSKYREMIEKSFPYILEECFGGYFHPPVLSTMDDCNSDDEDQTFCLSCVYHNPEIAPLDSGIASHAVMDIVQAFIDGMIYCFTSDAERKKGKENV